MAINHSQLLLNKIKTTTTIIIIIKYSSHTLCFDHIDMYIVYISLVYQEYDYIFRLNKCKHHFITATNA